MYVRIATPCMLVWMLFLPRPTAGETPPESDAAKPLTQVNDKLLADVAPGVRLGIWVGRPDGTALFTHDADAVMPTASSIKTALLIELFAMQKDNLDARPDGVAAIFQEADHPAFVHYREQDRKQSQEALTKMSVEQLGTQMIRVDVGPNLVYNGAANVVIALLGGPAEATARIHQRSGQFAGHTVNRYMLADRNTTGDNTATAVSLAAVHAALARREVKGLKADTIERLRKVLLLEQDKSDTSHYFKGGSLASAPATQVRAGWWEGKQPTVVYAIMAAADPESDNQISTVKLEEYVAKLEAMVRKRFFDQ